MTDDQANRSTDPAPDSAWDPAPEPASVPPPSFEERMERFGHEAEEAGKRIAANPTIVDAADTAARVWGLLLIAVGAWFLAEFTLGYDLPTIPWGDVWPLGLILIGLVVVLRGMTRRSA